MKCPRCDSEVDDPRRFEFSVDDLKPWPVAPPNDDDP
jgi:hypothetical protein